MGLDRHAQDPESFAQSHRVLAELLPKNLNTWNVLAGDLVIDITMATPAMAAAMTLVGFPYAARVMTLGTAGAEKLSDPKVIVVGETPRLWTQSNPWDEEVVTIRKEASAFF